MGSRGPKITRMARVLGGLALVGVLGATTPEASAENNASAVVVLDDQGSSLSQLGRAMQKLPLTSESLVAVGLPRTGDGPLPDQVGNALWSALQKNVAALVPLAKIQVTTPLSNAQARLRARRADLALTYLAPELRGGNLVLRVTQSTWAASFWQRALSPEGNIAHETTFAVAADTQVRSFFGTAPTLLERVANARTPVSSPLAVACGSFGNSEEEVVVVGRQEIAIGRIQEGRFVVRKRASWGSLSVVSPTPLRAPLASVVFQGDSLIVASSDRAEMVRLSADLQLLGRAPRRFPLSSGECSRFTETGIGDRFESCPPFDPSKTPALEPLTPGPGFDTVARATHTEPSGVQTEVSAALKTGEATLRLSVTSASHGKHEIEIEGAGSALLLADIDGNGSLDVVTSSDAKDETLAVATLRGETLVPLARRSLDQGIAALTACPFSGQNPLTLVTVTNQDVLVFH